MIPQIRYLAQDTMVAFGDNKVILFTGAQKPVESKVIELKDQVKSIFYNENQFGLVYDGEKGSANRLELDQLSGEKRQELNFDIDDKKVEILDNGELCIQGEDSCEIYNAKGICKFKYQFKEYLYKVLSGNMQTDYTFILEGETQKVKLK